MKRNHSENNRGGILLKSAIQERDMELLNEAFYWRHDDLYKRIKEEQARISLALYFLSQKDEFLSEEECIKLQQRIILMKKIQQKMTDKGLDNFKEIAYPFAKWVPALALFGLSGLSVVLGPFFAMLFAGGFLASNLYVKGSKSWMNVHFGIASTVQASALVVGTLILTGVAVVNPAVVTYMVLAGGVYLFGAAVERGRRRHVKAKESCLKDIKVNSERLHKEMEKIKELSELFGINLDYMDELLQSQLWQDEVKFKEGDLVKILESKEKDGARLSDEGAQELNGSVRLKEKDDQELNDDERLKLKNTAQKLMGHMRRLKLYHDELVYQLKDYDNLLRTVKNPIEKTGRVQDLRKIQKYFQEESPGFKKVTEDMTEKIKETGDDVKMVIQKDMPWFLSNITLLTIAALGIPSVGLVVFGAGAAVMFSPPVLITIGSLATAVGLIYAGFYVRQRIIERNRESRDIEKKQLYENLKSIESIDENINGDYDKKKDNSLGGKKKTTDTELNLSMRLDSPNEGRKARITNRIRGRLKGSDRKEYANGKGKTDHSPSESEQVKEEIRKKP